jgi:lantibiotic biosynthesis protein
MDRLEDPVWRPLLVAEERDHALAIVDYIANTLINPPVAWIPSMNAEPFRIKRGMSLGSGSAGIALFFSQYSKLPGREALGIQGALKMKAHTLSGLATAPTTSGFMNGAAGALWALEYTDWIDDLNAKSDVCCHAMAPQIFSRSVDEIGGDLWTGMTGHGVFALQIQEKFSDKTLVHGIVDKLLAWYKESGDQYPWYTLPRHLNPRLQIQYPRGFVNLGAAHGVSGIISFLATAYHLGYSRSDLAYVCDRAWQWLTKQIDRDDYGPYLPEKIIPGSVPHRSLNAWCNGMIGVSATLISAARFLGHSDMKLWAWNLGKDSAQQLNPRTQVGDACICHGAAGFAHQFNRLAQSTQDAQFYDSARLWYQKTLDFYSPGRGVGGFAALGYNREGMICELFEPGFIQGSAGIGLGLLAASTSYQPRWDRALLLS